MAEDFAHQYETEHCHLSMFVDSYDEMDSDDYQHDHEDTAHMHLVFQLLETEELTVITPPVQKLDDCDWAFCSTTVSPPVPPPNYILL